MPRGYVIALATAAHCDQSTGNCNIDGSPSTRGCGWLVDIVHPGGVVTRYCHMVQQPFVTAGQTVAAGQVIGLVGTSGNSSGPPLHFEIHTGVPVGARPDKTNSVDPVPFMQAAGAPLGKKE
ncbi:M23 family metallopeptidase [Dactylosporangium sp. NPDC000555]|uniref:M23 family metallopeptidase n=1 Tax=Dactylosporangium sp. NPDC000555 TaxID=3154260 RepID=UPI0033327CF0